MARNIICSRARKILQKPLGLPPANMPFFMLLSPVSPASSTKPRPEFQHWYHAKYAKNGLCS
ncbi:uncharacterized protein LOC142565904 isoform X2 [Dermacentor variabilis]|uniref:uncharacterized protein LOC142565904 isoform X2 n=1 Tax=Dermacentor variabilis TaxID=34621 RepID=UPI003F5C92CE